MSNVFVSAGFSCSDVCQQQRFTDQCSHWEQHQRIMETINNSQAAGISDAASLQLASERILLYSPLLALAMQHIGTRVRSQCGHAVGNRMCYTENFFTAPYQRLLSMTSLSGQDLLQRPRAQEDKAIVYVR